MGKQETLETIWEVPDELWERIEPQSAEFVCAMEDVGHVPSSGVRVRHRVDVV